MTELARDAVYVAVGLGVLGVQRAQVHRAELQKRLGRDVLDADLAGRLGGARSALSAGVEQLDVLLEEAGRFVEDTLQPIEAQLPPQVRAIAQLAQDQARGIRSQLRLLVDQG
ncbi:MAG: hypothetical protein ACYCU7_02605 [Acidimicrobiales bacterium]